MLKACAPRIVKSVFFRFCSNTTAEVKNKSKDVQPGKPPKWCFVIHDSEGVPSSLRTRKFEPCYTSMKSCTISENSTQP